MIIMTQRDSTVNWMEGAARGAADAANELCKAMEAISAELAAVKTLEALGYKWNGGELWKPPLGEAPDYIKQEPHTTYEKVTFDNLSDAFAEHEKAPLYSERGRALSMPLSDNNYVLYNFNCRHPLYRKVEITPMQAAKEACNKFISKSKRVGRQASFNSFIDSACGSEWDREWDNEFISTCRAIVEAYDGK